MAADRAGAPPRAWQRMLSGRRLDCSTLRSTSRYRTSRMGLRVARWNGQTGGDHAFWWQPRRGRGHLLRLVPGPSPDARLTALLHDAPEYVIGDMISPFKSAVGGGYKAVEQRLQRAIHLRFSLPADTAEKLKRDIKRADQVAAYFEATLLAGFSIAEATQFFGRPRGISADRFDLACKPAKSVQSAFLKRFASIEKLR